MDKKEIDIFNSCLEFSFSKNKKNKISNKTKMNNVISKNISNLLKERQPKINDNDIKKNGLINLNKLKEKTTLYYLTNISEELKAKKKIIKTVIIFLSALTTTPMITKKRAIKATSI